MYKIVFILVYSLLSAKGIAQKIVLDGPYLSWVNVKLKYGAKGDGITDDTKAIQRAIDSFSNRTYNQRMDEGKRQFVLYFPKGTYKIGKKLLVKGQIGISMIGENPTNTVFIWDGNNADTMIHFNGSAYFKMSRFSFKTGGKKNLIAVGLHWRDRYVTKNSQSYASLNNEFSDLVFNDNFLKGLSCGTYTSDGTGNNDSEITVKRCQFTSNTIAMAIKGYNALDYWIWDCKFQKCKIAVQNQYGNYHVYNSWFNQIDSTAFLNEGGYYTTVRNNTFQNIRILSYDVGSSCNAFKRLFQGNIVKGCKLFPIYFYHLGYITLLNNHFEGIQQNQLVEYGGWCKGNYGVLEMNNSYTVAKPYFRREEVHPTKIIKYTTSTTKKLVVISEPIITYTNKNEPYFDFANSFEALQIFLNTAKSNNILIHIKAGTFTLPKTIKIPGNKVVRIVGDGLQYASTIMADKDNFVGQSLIEVPSNSSVFLEHIILQQNESGGNITGILYHNKKSEKANFLFDQIYVESDTTLYVDQSNNTNVYKTNSFFSDHTVLKELTNFYAIGAQAVGATLYNNSKLIGVDCWWEGHKRTLSFKGNGTLFIDGALWAPNIDSKSDGNIFKDFTGKLFISNLYTYGNLVATGFGNKPLQFFLWNYHNHTNDLPTSFVNNVQLQKGVIKAFTYQSTSDKDKNSGQITSLVDYSNLEEENEKALFKEYYNLQEEVLSALKVLQKPFINKTCTVTRVGFINLKYGIKIIE